MTSPFSLEVQDLTLECLNDMEGGFLLSDVETYFMGGIELSPGDTVLDVGANIGAFTATVWSRLGGDVRLFSFEPMPPIREVLERNVASQMSDAVTVVPCGLGRESAELEFSYFPGMTVLSSVARDGAYLEAERKRLVKTVMTMIDEGRAYPLLRPLPADLVEAIVEGHVMHMTQPRKYPATIRTLSEVMRERGIDSIDLLKIDVEGAELDVLDGVASEDWARVAQVAMEVEHFGEREAEVYARLEPRGFALTSRQDAVERAGDYGMIYARRSP